MSTDYSAVTIVGYKIDTSNFYEEVKKPNCGHNPPKDVKFCPTCGTKVGFHTEHHCVDEEGEFTDFVYGDMPEGYVHETEYDNNDFFWIGYGNSISSHCTDQAEKMKIKSFDEIKEEIADFLAPWISKGFIKLDETTFGIWTIMGIH